VVGPPLTRSIGAHLVEAGVTFAVAVFISGKPPTIRSAAVILFLSASLSDMPSDYKIHDLGPEAWWTAKNAGLSEQAALDLVTTNVEAILGLSSSKDIVVFEGNPLRYGATVVLSFHADSETGQLQVGTCFPGEG
jgi:hypothetical protein